MLGRVGAGLRSVLGRASGLARNAKGGRKLAVAAGVGVAAGLGLGGAALGSPAQAQDSPSSWRFTAPAAESRAAARKKAASNQEGFSKPPIVVTISGAAGQIAYSEPHLISSSRCLCTRRAAASH